MKNKEGQKYVFVFYEREFIPQIEPRILNQYMSMFQDRPNIQQTLSGLFEFFRRDISFDVDLVKRSYADSSISIHFLFLTKPAQRVYGILMQEQSEYIYSVVREMSLAMGGYAE